MRPFANTDTADAADDRYTEFGAAGEPPELDHDDMPARRPLCPRCDGYGQRAGCFTCTEGFV